MPNEALSINLGLDVKAKAPETRSNEFLLQVVTNDGTWNLCADSVDEMLAWQMALEQARTARQQIRRPNSQMPSHLVEVLENSKLILLF